METSNIDLLFGLLKHLHKSGSNLILSNYSLVSGLSMLAIGTRGKSRQELLTALIDKPSNNVDENIKSLSEQYLHLIQCYQKTICDANFFYYNEDVELNEQFLDNLIKLFNAHTKRVDFKNDKQLVESINEDISKQTNGLVSSMLDQICSTTKVLLINAIHFKADWVKQFDETQTQHDYSFRLSNGQTSLVKMMRQEGFFPYCSYDAFKLDAIKISYNSSMFMLILLPNEIASLDHLVCSLKSNDFNQILNQMKIKKIQLCLPRFKIVSKHQLVPHLQVLNIRAVFNPLEADMTGMTDMSSKAIGSTDSKLYVSDVIQMAAIEVNEQGTEALAITKCVGRVKRSCEDVLQFICDHPFLFFILNHDDQKSKVLFSGIVHDPSTIN